MAPRARWTAIASPASTCLASAAPACRVRVRWSLEGRWPTRSRSARAAGAERFHFVGESVGGTVGLLLGSRRPDALLSLTVSNASHRGGSIQRAREWREFIRANGMAKWGEMMAPLRLERDRVSPPSTAGSRRPRPGAPRTRCSTWPTCSSGPISRPISAASRCRRCCWRPGAARSCRSRSWRRCTRASRARSSSLPGRAARPAVLARSRVRPRAPRLPRSPRRLVRWRSPRPSRRRRTRLGAARRARPHGVGAAPSLPPRAARAGRARWPRTPSSRGAARRPGSAPRGPDDLRLHARPARPGRAAGRRADRRFRGRGRIRRADRPLPGAAPLRPAPGGALPAGARCSIRSAAGSSSRAAAATTPWSRACATRRSATTAPQVGVLHARRMSSGAAAAGSRSTCRRRGTAGGPPAPLVVALHGGSGHGRDFLWAGSRGALARRAAAVAHRAGPHVVDHGRRGRGRRRGSRSGRVRGRALPGRPRARAAHRHVGRRHLRAAAAGSREGMPFTHLAPACGVLHPFLLARGRHPAGARAADLPGPRRARLDVPGADRAHEPGRARRRRAREVVYREIEDLSHTYPRDENPRILDWLARG